MREFKFLNNNERVSEDMEILHPYIIPRNIINIGPIMDNPFTSEPVRGITYSVDGNRKYSLIGEGHPLWDEIPNIV